MLLHEVLKRLYFIEYNVAQKKKYRAGHTAYTAYEKRQKVYRKAYTRYG